MSESLVSINLNFTDGNSHTASTVSIVDAINIAADGDSLGTIISSSGYRPSLSNSKLNSLLKNFIQIEQTTSRDGVKTQISRKYMDRTSLLLKSHCIAVRGKDVSPKGVAYDGIVFDYSECKGSPVASFGKQSPFKTGGVIVLGNIYNEISETDEQSGIKISLIFLGRQIQPNLCLNLDRVSNYYLSSPDLAKSELKLGYTLNEFKSAASLAGIFINGLPSKDLLFDYSGTLESVISSIASSLGMYWYVDPSSGTVNLISSSIAATKKITDPTKESGETYLDCSYSSSSLGPVFATSYMSTTGPKKETPDDGDKMRTARFRVCDILGNIDIKIPQETLQNFYGAHCSSTLNETVFDAFVYKLLVDNSNLDFGGFYTKPDNLGDEFISFDKVYLEQAENQAKKFKGSFDLNSGKFLLKSKFGDKPEEPSGSEAFKLIPKIFDVLSNSIYISNRYSEWKARRMQFSSSDVNVSGPFKLDDKIEDIDGMGAIYALLKQLGKESITIRDLANAADVKGLGDSVFIGVKQFGNKVKPKTADLYEDFTDKNFISYDDGALNRTWAAYSASLFGKINTCITESKTLYKKIVKEDTVKSVRASYTRTKIPVNDYLSDLKDRDTQQAVDDADAEKNESDSQISDLFDKMNWMKCSLKLNGASGGPLSPMTLEVKNAKPAEVSLLSQNNYGQVASGFKLATSSKTIVGLFVPAFTITLSGISITVGNDGIKTTITESNKNLLPVDDSVIIGQGMKSYISKTLASRFSASQRNFLGL